MIHILCSSTQFFTASRVKRDLQPGYPGPIELVVDHYTPGNYLYVFEEGNAPFPVDLEAIKKREAGNG